MNKKRTTPVVAVLLRVRAGRVSIAPAALLYLVMALAVAVAACPAQAGQVIFMSQTGNTVGEYNAITGATVNAAFISGTNPTGLALDGNNHLFVINRTNTTVGEYNATTGATINAAFINGQGLNDPGALAVDALHNLLFVAGLGVVNGTLGEYNATTGATINATFITSPGPFNPNGGLALDRNNHLFVVDNDQSVVGEYDATTGAAINAAFITTFSGNGAGLTGVALDGSNHLFTSYGNVVGEFDATTGATVNAAFISHGGSYLAFASTVPEPSTFVLAGIGFLSLLACIRQRRRRM